MEHVWVEAAVDYLPSRAAVNKSADTWIALDPSFKQYEFTEGIDVAAVTGIDPQQTAQAFLDSGTIDEQAGWVQGTTGSTFEFSSIPQYRNTAIPAKNSTLTRMALT